MKEDIQFKFWDGQLFELSTSNKEVFFTQVMKSESDLFIQIPINQKRIPMRIDNGMSITVNYFDHINRMYTFETKIRRLEKGGIVLDTPPEDAIKKVQRRHYFRVNVNTELHLEFESQQDEKEMEKLITYTYDLSGGGLSFLHPSKVMENGEIVQGTLYLNKPNQLKRVNFTGKVVNKMKHEQDFHRVSLKFEEISEAQRSDVIEFCISKQIELRKKVGRTR